jgi:protein-S-isoprenylcysteine O-methyltransferase Ste14
MILKLLFNAIIKFVFGLLLVGLVIFLPAGTLAYLNGWLFVALLFIPILLFGTVLFFKSPELLRRRLDSKEKERSQKGVVGLSALMFLGGFILAGLDYRFGWSAVPTWAVIVASIVLLAAYALYVEVMRENEYLSRTVKVEEGQKVIDTGLYGVVRHPMYAVTLWLFLSIPIVLGSWYSLICFAHYPIIIIVRLLNEEKLLSRELDGYEEYKKKVKYRLIPFVW